MDAAISWMDLIQSIGVVVTIIISIVALVQAEHSGRLALEVSQKELKDTQKDSIPLVQFTGRVEAVSKSIFDLENENTFDFNQLLCNLPNEDIDECYGSEEGINCISTKIKNCGFGFITGMEITDFYIIRGNKTSIENEPELDGLCLFQGKDMQKKCAIHFNLAPGEETTINFIITKKLMKEKGLSFDEAEDMIADFINESDNITVSMCLNIMSINTSSYKQKSLWGTYVNGEIVHNSFIDVVNV